MDCYAREIARQRGENVPVTGPVDPGVVDPSPLEGGAIPDWMRCLDSIPGANVDRSCWAAQCIGPGYTVAVGGGCQCETTPSGGIAAYENTCGHVDCADGVPIYQNGFCMCQPPGGSGPPRGPFVVDRPMRILESRRHEFELVTGSPSADVVTDPSLAPPGRHLTPPPE
jgi:hypothetical protein